MATGGDALAPTSGTTTRSSSDAWNPGTISSVHTPGYRIYRPAAISANLGQLRPKMGIVCNTSAAPVANGACATAPSSTTTPLR